MPDEIDFGSKPWGNRSGVGADVIACVNTINENASRGFAFSELAPDGPDRARRALTLLNNNADLPPVVSARCNEATFSADLSELLTWLGVRVIAEDGVERLRPFRFYLLEAAEGAVVAPPGFAEVVLRVGRGKDRPFGDRTSWRPLP